MANATSVGRSVASTRTTEDWRSNATIYVTSPRERIPATTGERVAEASLADTPKAANRRRRECRAGRGGSSEDACQDDPSWAAADDPR